MISNSLIEGLKCHLIALLHYSIFAMGNSACQKAYQFKNPSKPQHKDRPVCVPNTKLAQWCLLASWVLSCGFHSSPELSSLPDESRASLPYFFLFRNGIHFYLQTLQRIYPSVCCDCSAHFKVSGFTHNPEQDHFNPCREFTVRQIPFITSPIQCRLLSVYILGIHVLEHKTSLEKSGLWDDSNNRNEMMGNGTRDWSLAEE